MLQKTEGVSDRGTDAYLFDVNQLVVVLHAADGLSLANVLHTCYKHLAGLVFCLGFVKFEHGGDHTARFGRAFEQM